MADNAIGGASTRASIRSVSGGASKTAALGAGDVKAARANANSSLQTVSDIGSALSVLPGFGGLGTAINAGAGIANAGLTGKAAPGNALLGANAIKNGVAEALGFKSDAANSAQSLVGQTADQAAAARKNDEAKGLSGFEAVKQFAADVKTIQKGEEKGAHNYQPSQLSKAEVNTTKNFLAESKQDFKTDFSSFKSKFEKDFLANADEETKAAYNKLETQTEKNDFVKKEFLKNEMRKDADGNYFSKNIKSNFFGAEGIEDGKTKTQLQDKGILGQGEEIQNDDANHEFNQFNGDVGLMYDNAQQAADAAASAQNTIENSNLSREQKDTLQGDGQSLAFMKANRLNSLGAEKVADMLIRDKAHIDNVKKEETGLMNIKGGGSAIKEKANEVNEARFDEAVAKSLGLDSAKDLSSADQAKFNEAKDAAVKYAQENDIIGDGANAFANQDGAKTFQDIADHKYVFDQSGEDGLSQMQRDIIDSAKDSKSIGFDVNSDVLSDFDTSGHVASVTRGLEHAQKSALKDLVGVQTGDGTTNQINLTNTTVDGQKENLSKMAALIKDAKAKASKAGNEANVTSNGVTTNYVGHGDKQNFYDSDGKVSDAELTEAGKATGELTTELNALNADVNCDHCYGADNADAITEGIKEGNDDSNALQISSRATEGTATSSAGDVTDTKGITQSSRTANGSNRLNYEFSQGKKGTLNDNSTVQKVSTDGAGEDAFKGRVESQVAALEQKVEAGDLESSNENVSMPTETEDVADIGIRAEGNEVLPDDSNNTGTDETRNDEEIDKTPEGDQSIDETSATAEEPKKEPETASAE